MPAATPARPSRPSRPRGAPAPTIRWDRVSRFALLLVLVAIAFLYLRPTHSLWVAWRQSRATDAHVARLERERARLEARRRALLRPDVLEREARKLGYVRPGERPYVVEGLPKGR